MNLWLVATDRSNNNARKHFGGKTITNRCLDTVHSDQYQRVSAGTKPQCSITVTNVKEKKHPCSWCLVPPEKVLERDFFGTMVPLVSHLDYISKSAAYWKYS